MCPTIGTKSICIIGGGPGGLYVLKHALEQQQSPGWTCTLFERAAGLGGIWRFTPDKGSPLSRDRFPSPMHRDLIMNSPKDTCKFMDVPWPSCLPTFPSRQDAFEYLSNYADEHKLREHMKFNQEVILIKPVDPSNRLGTKWNVITECTRTNELSHFSFDKVVVCTGHEMVPRQPGIENLEAFKGLMLFATDYVDSSPFVGKRVLIRSAGPSGLDLMSHLRKVTSELILSTNPSSQLFEVGLPENVKTVAAIRSATKSGFVLQDGTELFDIDVLILCTGYAFDYKFLSPSCGVELSANNTIIRPLYRHIVNTKYPGLCFIGVIAYVPAFYALSIQVKWLMKYLTGSIGPVNESEMNAEIAEEDILPSHNIFEVQWDYYKKLAREAGLSVLPYVEKLFTHVVPRVFNDNLNYRKDKYIQMDGETFHVEQYEPEPELNQTQF